MRTAPDGRPGPPAAVAIALAAVVLASLWPVLGHDFITSYDDERYVTGNPHVLRGLTLDGIRWAWTTTHAANWHPLTWMSHMLDVQLYGLSPAGHHLTSLLLHVANTLLLFLALRLATGATLRSGIAAALFGVHPLHVESVAWVAERKDVLSALFWMLALVAYVRYARAPSARRYVPVAAALGLGLCAKPMLVTLPLVLLLLDLWPLGRLAGVGPRALRPRIREKVPLLALSAASSAITLVAQSSGEAVAALERLPLTERLANSVVSYAAYLRKTVWPLDLAVFYPHPRGAHRPWEVAGAALLLVLATILAARVRRKRPYVLVGWLWYLGTLVPVIGWIQVGDQAMADRYTYLPLVGIFVIAAWGVADLAAAVGASWLRRGPPRTLAAADSPWILLPSGVAILALAACARVQAGTWRDSVSLFEHALEKTRDNPVAHSNLGHARRGAIERAERHYREALRLEPGHPESHNGLGLLLHETGRLEQAVAHYESALRSRPGYPEAHNNLGRAFQEMGRLEQAVAHYESALRLRPGYVEARNNLGVALLGSGRAAEAIPHLEEAVRLDPADARAHNNLGRALAETGRPAEAIRLYEQALRLRPGYAEAHNNLGVALFGMGRAREAVEHYRKALASRPDYPEAESNLGGALTSLGRLDEAVEHLTRAIRLDPGYAVAHHNLAVALALAGDLAGARREADLARRHGFEPPPGFRHLLAGEAARNHPRVR